MISLALGLFSLVLCGSFLNKLKNFLPYNLGAGFLLLLIGEFVDLGNFHEHIGISLCAVFVCAGLTTRERARPSRNLFLYSLLQYTSQWSIGLGGYLVFLLFFKLDPIVALAPAAGLSGGHGSAAFLGEVFSQRGNEAAYDLLMFSATVGVMIAVLGQVLLAKRSSIQYDLFSINRFKGSWPSWVLVVLICGLSIVLSEVVLNYLKFKIPYFVFGFLISTVVKSQAMFRTVDSGGVSNLASELLIVFGVGSVSLSNIKDELVPLVGLILLCVVVAFIFYKWIGLKLFGEDSFLMALFTWGWSMAGIGISVGAINSINPDKAQLVLKRYAPVYFLIAPIELTLLLLAPFMVFKTNIFLSFTIFALISLAIILYLKPQVAENS